MNNLSENRYTSIYEPQWQPNSTELQGHCCLFPVLRPNQLKNSGKLFNHKDRRSQSRQLCVHDLTFQALAMLP